MRGRYIFVVGGVYSGTGKGISAASLGLLLKMRGCDVNLIKCDPYLNINAGTMSPAQHGEVFLCEDGSETDLDLGHYERITGIPMSSRNIFTSGLIHKSLIEEEENGKYLGKTVQVTPHVTNKIKDRITALGEKDNIVIAEVGGTVGDNESWAFYEAIRRLKQNNPDDVMIVMVAPILWNNTVKELKTKPLQNSVKTLLSQGLQPEMLLCRCDREIPEQILDKIAEFTNAPREAIFRAPDVESIYEVPIKFYEQHVDDLIADKFHLPRKGVKIHKHRGLVEKYNNGHGKPTVNIAVVGKYENCDEAYVSLKEALMHAAVHNGVKIHIEWLQAEHLENSPQTVALDRKAIGKQLEGIHGLIVPGGFDIRGVAGKIGAIRYCRERKIPFLGICLGLQCAVIEFARNVAKLPGNVTSREFIRPEDKDYTCVIEFVEGQKDKTKKSGTMRLGSYNCTLEDGIIRRLYGKKNISERHRHRYEVNNEFVAELEKKGFRVTGRNPEQNLVEMMELAEADHPYFVGTQSHPEYKSRLDAPAPLFAGLVVAAKCYLEAHPTESASSVSDATNTV